MAADPTLPVQAAIFAALSEPGVQTAMGQKTGVYDRVPATAAYPYVGIGQIALRPFKAVGFDGWDVDATLQIWSRGVGSVEAKRIASACGDRLAPLQGPGDTPPLTIAGHVLHLWENLGFDVLQDPNDDLATHIPLRLRFRTQPAA